MRRREFISGLGSAAAWPPGKQWRYNKISGCPPMTLGNMRELGGAG